MNTALQLGKRAFTTAIVAATILWSAGLMAFVPSMASAASAGDLIKGTTLSTVYYYAGDGKRYAFPNETTYMTWYSDFSDVMTISDSELAAIPLGGNITIRPGAWWVRITSDPKVYAVATDGSLHWIESEEVATAFAGSDWNMRIVDVPDVFFAGDYTAGASLMSATAYDGMLWSEDGNTYLAWDGEKRMVSDAGFSANRLQSRFVLDGTGIDDSALAAGADITASDAAVADTAQQGGVVAEEPGEAVSVSLASDNPSSGTLIAGQGIGDLAHFTFTNPNDSEAKVTKLVVKRNGVSSDTTLTSVYLFDGYLRSSDSATVSSGNITFNDTSGLFTIPAGGSKSIAIRGDISSSAAGGQTIGVSIESADSVTVSTGSVSGSFPLSGNLMSLAASVSNFATVSFAAATPSAASIDPQNDYTVWQSTTTVSNTKVTMYALRFRQIGSINSEDVENYRLYVDGVQVGDAVANSDANGYVAFDLSDAPVTLQTGSRVIKVLADIIGGTTRTVQISHRVAADAYLVDFDYGQPVLVQRAGTTFSSNDAGAQTINSGSLTISKLSDSPSGNITDASTSAVLAKFELKAFGEKMKVESLDFNVAEDDADTAYKLRNGAIYANGDQVGSTTAICGDDTTTSGACTGVAGSGASYTRFTFGSSLVVEPGSPVTLEVKADVYDSDGSNGIAANDTMQVVVNGDSASSNVLRMTSNSYASVPSADVSANSLTVATGSLAVAVDQSYGNQTVVVPQSAYLLGKYTVTAGANEDINITTFTVTLTGTNAFAVTDTNNLYLVYGAKTSAIKATGAASQDWSVNETLAKNQTLAVSLYGDIAAAADSTSTADTLVSTLALSGTAADSATAVTASAATGQTITTAASGNLTVQLDNSSTPIAQQVIAGSAPDAGSLVMKLSASSEDLYVKTLQFRVDTNADDAGVASMAVYAKSGSGSYAQVGVAQTLNSDGTTNPGYVTWNLEGTDRIKVAKDSTVYVKVSPTYVSSGQTSVTGLTPAIYLADIDVDGTSGVLSAADSDGSDLDVESGILVGTDTSPTFAADATATTYSSFSSTTATTLTVNAAPTTDRTGSFALIDVNADATYDNGSDEIVYVMEGNTSDTTVLIVRGVLGTTAVSDAAGNVYFYGGINGNAQTILNTKLGLALASDSPSGATTGSTGKVVFKFVASAENNSVDAAENKATLTTVEITTTKSSATVKNLKVYPSEFDNNSSYDTVCYGMTTTVWRCVMDTTGATNEIVENTSRTYVVRGDVGYSGAGSVEVSIGNLGSSSASSFTDGDVYWTDGTTASYWVYQTTTFVQGSAQTTTAASGSADSTAPTISSIVFVDGTADNALTVGATITITFSEMMDPTTVGSLTPGASTAAITNAATGDIAVAGNNGAASGNDMLTITGIANVDLGANTFATGALTGAVTGALNTAGTVLTLTVSTALTGAGADGTEIFEPGSASTSMTDINGTAATAAGSNSATVTGVDL